MASYGLDIARAGWLYRRSSILHRWKKNWFVLDRQGDLRYFESPEAPRAEERIVVRASVLSIKAGPDCRRSDAPEGLSIARCGFLELKIREGDTMVLCADTFDDMKAWQISLEEARTMAMPIRPATTFIQPASYASYYSPYNTFNLYNPYNPYQMGFMNSYPGQVISAPGTQVIHAPTGTTTYSAVPQQQQVVIVDDDPYRYRRRGHYPRNYYW